MPKAPFVRRDILSLPASFWSPFSSGLDVDISCLEPDASALEDSPGSLNPYGDLDVASLHVTQVPMSKLSQALYKATSSMLRPKATREGELEAKPIPPEFRNPIPLDLNGRAPDPIPPPQVANPDPTEAKPEDLDALIPPLIDNDGLDAALDMDKALPVNGLIAV
ncbi:hypothetical protein C8J56DRAFT_903695 [Mycena floridula]|nr:hypothetical protein C8J56DRAFT_903695 [Mycena floridula]